MIPITLLEILLYCLHECLLKSKEFAFTRLITCGYCGSSITADEKFKKLKDGSVNRHVYYMCTKSKDTDCTNKNINETELIAQLTKLMDTVKLDDIGIQERIKQELRRYNKFRVGVLGEGKEKQEVSELDIRNYAKYILKEGTLIEKRELLMNLESKLQ